MRHLDLMPGSSLIVHYPVPDFPVYMTSFKLTEFENAIIPEHWQEAITVLRVLDGTAIAEINGRKIYLKKDDLICVNSIQTHSLSSEKPEEFHGLVAMFDLDLLTKHSSIRSTLIDPVFTEEQIPYYIIHAEDEASKPLATMLNRIYALQKTRPAGCRLEVVGILHIMLGQIINIYQPEIKKPKFEPRSELNIQRDMVSYIYRHYQEKVTLQDIAAAGKVCRSKCCILFKKFLKQSPIDYLNSYRLAVSRTMLENTEVKIADIATSCGFTHQSYYSKIFSAAFSCTPNEYRAFHRQKKRLEGNAAGKLPPTPEELKEAVFPGRSAKKELSSFDYFDDIDGNPT